MRIAVGVMALAAASACALAQDASNPVVASAKEIFQRQSGNMVAAAEQMPADKYGYHPTPDQWTYGKIVSHVAQANFGVCGMLSGDGPGKGPTVTDTTPKDQLVTFSSNRSRPARRHWTACRIPAWAERSPISAARRSRVRGRSLSWLATLRTITHRWRAICA